MSATRSTSRGPFQSKLFCDFNFTPQMPFSEFKYSKLLISPFVLHIPIFACAKHGMW